MSDATSAVHPAAINLIELPLEQAQAASASGTVTSEALTQAFLDRIAVHNPRYKAWFRICSLGVTRARGKAGL